MGGERVAKYEYELCCCLQLNLRLFPLFFHLVCSVFLKAVLDLNSYFLVFSFFF
jgi:hypothetical protein